MPPTIDLTRPLADQIREGKITLAEAEEEIQRCIAAIDALEKELRPKLVMKSQEIEA